jgi:hypothetical protein
MPKTRVYFLANDDGGYADVETNTEEAAPVDAVVIRRVVCAACKHRTMPLMLVGARHFDKVMHQQLDVIRKAYPCLNKDWEQGFIDQFGEFMGREEAMEVAVKARQPLDIERGCGGDYSTLYSEGLY